MKEPEMKEIASILKLVLSNTEAAIIDSGENKGKPSKVKYITSSKAIKEALERVAKLLGRFQVYPQLDLDFLEKHFGK